MSFAEFCKGSGALSRSHGVGKCDTKGKSGSAKALVAASSILTISLMAAQILSNSQEVKVVRSDRDDSPRGLELDAEHDANHR